MRGLEALVRADLRLLARILALLVTFNLALPFVRVKRLVGWLTPPSLPAARDLSEVQKVVRRLDGVLRRVPFLPYGHCLLRSLTLYYFCTRLGYPVQIAFGARVKPDGTMDGHGWLVLDGHPFMERGEPERNFLPLWRLPSTPPGSTPVRPDTAGAMKMR